MNDLDSMTQQQALTYCESRGLSPSMSKSRREAMTAEEAKVFMFAHASTDESGMNPEIVAGLKARAATRAEHRSSFAS